jgi:simple sugar transport system permease protein
MMALAGLALVVLVTLLVLTGHDATRALSALAQGAFGSWYAITSSTLVRAVPLALAGLAVAIAFRAGILNVGAEGQLLMGAAIGAATAATVGAMGWVPAPIAILVVVLTGAAAGGAWAAIAALLRQRFVVLEVISTIMLNFLAQYLVGWLVRGPLQESTHVNPQSAALPESLHLPLLLSGTRLHLGFVLAIALAVLAWWWLRSTASGFRLRAVGANATAAASAGQIQVGRTVVGAFVLSGALAGLAGAVEFSGVTFALYDNFSPGYGFTAIAVALLARLHPLGVLATALLFGALEAGANAMQRDAGVPNVVVSVVEAALILLVVAADRWQARAAARSEAGT